MSILWMSRGRLPFPMQIKLIEKDETMLWIKDHVPYFSVSEGFYNKFFATGVGGAESPEKSSKFRVTP
jgi:hypothetical protein